jgi:putative nucleotidyltransferase with HDIG domain
MKITRFTLRQLKRIKWLTALVAFAGSGFGWGRWLPYLFCGAILAFIALPDLNFYEGRLEEGDINSRDVKAKSDITVVDEERTDKLREEALKGVRPVYRMRADIGLRTLREIGEAFAQIRSFKSQSRFREKDVADLRGLIKVDIPVTILNALLRQLNIDVIEDGVKRLVGKILNEGVVEKRGVFSLDESRGGITIVNPTTPGERYADISSLHELGDMTLYIDLEGTRMFPRMDNNTLYAIKMISRKFINPNLEYDSAATEARRREAASRVEPITIRFSRGEMIVREGERVSRDQAVVLGALYSSEKKSQLTSTAGTALIAFFGIVFLLLCLRQYRPDLYRDRRALTLIIVTLLIPIGITRLVHSQSFLPNLLVPAALAPLLLTVLLDVDVALMSGAFMGLSVGLISGYNFIYALQAFLAGAVGAYTSADIRRRVNLFRPGFFISATNFAVALLGGLMDGAMLEAAFRESLWGLGNGFLIAFLAMGLIPIFESLFNLTTHIKLVEMGDMSHPLLKQMRTRAQGTFFHSLAVATLAESAAEAIGADALLVRVATYYHDIGKIRRPEYFTENQIGAQKRKHDRLSPYLSKSIIVSHVKDGVEMARDYKLPRVFIDMIREHQGTGVISYFYHKAKEKGWDDVREDDFRYPGPKPQTKETGIVMLADSVEGASRALVNPTPKSIREMVGKVVRTKFLSGELDECSLTFNDLEKIADSFIDTLTSTLHTRVEYPRGELDEKIERAAEEIAMPIEKNSRSPAKVNYESEEMEEVKLE